MNGQREIAKDDRQTDRLGLKNPTCHVNFATSSMLLYLGLEMTPLAFATVP